MARILLLESDKLLTKVYAQSLVAGGHEVMTHHDAQAAVTILDEQSIDLVVLELALAGHNGVELLYEMRSYPDWDHIPVVLHTMVPPSHPGLGRTLWKELGIAAYLYKPQTSLAQLVQKVNRTVPAVA